VPEFECALRWFHEFAFFSFRIADDTASDITYAQLGWQFPLGLSAVAITENTIATGWGTNWPGRSALIRSSTPADDWSALST
jgi:hypothetical protein